MAGLGTSLPRSTRLCRIRPAHRPATARSWSRLPARNPKIGFGLSPDPGRPGRRRRQVWGPACRSPRDCAGYDSPIGRQQPYLGPGCLPATAGNPKIGFKFGLSLDPGSPEPRRGQVWGPACRSPRGRVGYDPSIGRQQPAHRQATARSFSGLSAGFPKIGFGLSPDPGRPGRSRRQVWGPACRSQVVSTRLCRIP